MFQKYRYRGASILAMEDFSDFWRAFGGPQGFEILRKVAKQNNDMCRTLVTLMQERIDLDLHYCKTLNRIGIKVGKVASQCVGTMETAWQQTADSMAQEAKYHQQLASAILEYVLEPMRNLGESFCKNRKPVEVTVDKKLAALAKARSDEDKLKQKAFQHAKEAHKCHDAFVKAKASALGSNDKETQKTDKKSRNADDACLRAEREYYDAALKAENARLDLEATMYKGCAKMQILEMDRLKQFHEILKKYHHHLSAVTNNHIQLCENLLTSLQAVDNRADLVKMVEMKAAAPHQPNQILVDFYSEDLACQMDVERRKHFIITYVDWSWEEWEKEKRNRAGIDKLMDVCKRENLMNENTKLLPDQEGTRQELICSNALSTYLEACHFKFLCLNNKLREIPRPTNDLSPYLAFGKDKHGYPQSYLRMPLKELSYLDAEAPGPANPDEYDDYMEFSAGMFEDVERISGRSPSPMPPSANSSRDDPSMRSAASGSSLGPTSRLSPRPYSSSTSRDCSFRSAASNPVSGQPLGTCRALYNFLGRDKDELSFKKDEIITITKKTNATWWEGESGGSYGLFPANYVEMI